MVEDAKGGPNGDPIDGPSGVPDGGSSGGAARATDAGAIASAPATGGARGWIPAFAAAVAALVFAAVAPPVGPWGDGLGILAALTDASGANPRAYHAGYALIAGAAVDLGAALGVAPEVAALWASRLALVVGAALVVRSAQRLGARPLAACGWSVVALASPSLLFFSGAVEVHALQFAGSAAALWLVARVRGRASLALRVVAALVAIALALFLHLSHLLLAPALVVFALGEARDAGEARRTWIGIGALAAVGAAAAVGLHLWFAGSAQGADPPEGAARAAWYLGHYQHLFITFKEQFGWFGPGGMARHFAAEGPGQGGFVWLAAFLALAWTRGRTRLALVLLLCVYLTVVSQAGIRERGGYYVSLMPWFAALAAAASAGRGRAWCLVPWLCLPLQFALGWNELAGYAERPDARSWARAVVAAVEEPCTVFTADMVRLSALPLEPGRLDGLAWSQQFEFTPRGNWDATLRVPYEQALLGALATGRVYLDADVVGAGRPLHERAAWQRWADDLLDRPGVGLVPVEGEPFLLELVLEPLDGAAPK